MKSRPETGYIIAFLIVIMMLGLLASTGCGKKEPDYSTTAQAPTPAQLASTRVPNVPLDVYLYVKQDNPTRLPAPLEGPADVLDVEPVSGWGVPGDDGLAFGVALTLVEDADASMVYSRIGDGSDIWKMLSGRVIYLVYGSGSAAEALKSAITKKDFKNYDDEKALAAVAGMPAGASTRLAAIILAKPTAKVLDYLSEVTDAGNMSMINTALTAAQLELVAAGWYSSQQIDGEDLTRSVTGNFADVLDRDIGILLMAKSELPGFIVGTAVSEYLKQYDFVETKTGETTVYELVQPAGDKSLTILVRVVDNTVFAAVSGRTAYALTLIMGVTP